MELGSLRRCVRMQESLGRTARLCTSTATLLDPSTSLRRRRADRSLRHPHVAHELALSHHSVELLDCETTDSQVSCVNTFSRIQCHPMTVRTQRLRSLLGCRSQAASSKAGHPYPRKRKQGLILTDAESANGPSASKNNIRPSVARRAGTFFIRGVCPSGIEGAM